MKNPTSLRLPSWKGYRAGKGDDASDGVMEVGFHIKVMTPLQRAALIAAEKRDAARHDALVDAILAAYPDFRPWKPRPKAMTKALLKSHVRLWEVQALADEHDGVAYVAYGFSCSWDPSGFRIVTHGDRIALAGGFEVLEYPIRDPMRPVPVQHLPTDAARAKVRAAAERRAKKNPKTLRIDDAGMATVFLPAWSGHVNRPGDDPADGEILIELDGGLDFAVAPAQQAAYRHVVEHEGAMHDRVCDAIVASFAKLTKGCDDEDLPERIERAALRDFIDLRNVTLSAAERDGVAYVGYDIGCRWDREHGLGVMTHENRVVRVGSADIIFDWTRDQDRPPGDVGRASKPAPKKPAPKKPAPKKNAR